MPISEKTVELNVSRTVVEKMRRYHKLQAYALGTTQTEEQMFGLDVEVTDGSWSGGCIQYKRLYRKPLEDRWNLNRTTNRDQHTLLCLLENAGFPVFYCFPKFDDESVLRRWTPPPLWTEVWWIRPSQLKVPAPVDDHHHLILKTTPATATTKVFQSWWIHSEEGTELDWIPINFDEVESAFMQAVGSNLTMTGLKKIVNEFAESSWRTFQEAKAQRIPAEVEAIERNAYFGNLLQGLGLMGFARNIEQNARSHVA